ncbi:MAG TPA: glycosyltransferase family 4 protein [Tepidisphaeraceae bacterium]|nr:glycosyltransferase family 4 protein [Tepidisphaeraceae bacterium]
MFTEHTTSRLSLCRRVWTEWRKGGQIICHLKKHSAGAVIVNGYNDAARLRIIRWCRRHGIPCFLWADSNIRGDTTKGLKRLVKNVLVRSVVRSCTGLLPCGQLGQAYFQRYGGQRDRMFLLPLEADYDLINGLRKDTIDQVCSQYGLQLGRRRIVYSGRLVGLKRVDLLIDAFAAIAAQRPEWDLVLVGDGVLRQQLAARVPAQLQGRVFWTGFLEDQAAISAIYRASDVLALCSEYEAWALVVIEAAAAGLALVCSDQVGAAPELLQDRRNGRLFPSGNLQALIESLLDVTAPDHIDAMKAATGAVLDDWRRRADPIQGLRQALRFCGVLPEHSPSTR